MVCHGSMALRAASPRRVGYPAAMESRAFHHAIPVRDLDETRRFRRPDEVVAR
jgi:hypothetical protein